MTVQVKASFGKDKKHLDGLDHHRKQLVDEPLRPRVIVGVINVSSISHDVLDGTDTPRIQFQQVEVLDGADAMKAVDMLNSAYQRRTGREDSQASLFDEWDPGAQNREAADAHRAAAIESAPPIDSDDDGQDDDPAADSTPQVDGDGEDLPGDQADDGGVPWQPDGAAFEGENGPWPGDVEFVEPPAAAVDPDVASEPDARRGRRGRK